MPYLLTSHFSVPEFHLRVLCGNPVTPVSHHITLPSLFLRCLCFGPLYRSSVFVSLYINSVIVTSGMCINCELPYPLSPLFPALSVSTSSPAFSFIPACFFPHPYPTLPTAFVSIPRDPQPQNGIHNQDLLVCACAVGVATCFAAPIGGKSRSLVLPAFSA